MCCVCCVTVRDISNVKHYRIRQMDEGGYYITRRRIFQTLVELVQHYSVESDGLCANLRRPCAQVGWGAYTGGCGPLGGVVRHCTVYTPSGEVGIYVVSCVRRKCINAIIALH